MQMYQLPESELRGLLFGAIIQYQRLVAEGKQPDLALPAAVSGAMGTVEGKAGKGEHSPPCDDPQAREQLRALVEAGGLAVT